MSQPSPQSREPQGLFEQITANSRPKPAIPALFATFAFVLFPISTMLTQSTEPASWQLWLVPLGLVASCALAIGAGLCSVAPPAIWILCAIWILSLIERVGLPMAHSYITFAGIAASAITIVVQIWRIRTGRFTPTIDE